jgi:hypothetical protein
MDAVLWYKQVRIDSIQVVPLGFVKRVDVQVETMPETLLSSKRTALLAMIALKAVPATRAFYSVHEREHNTMEQRDFRSSLSKR